VISSKFLLEADLWPVGLAVRSLLRKRFRLSVLVHVAEPTPRFACFCWLPWRSFLLRYRVLQEYPVDIENQAYNVGDHLRLLVLDRRDNTVNRWKQWPQVALEECISIWRLRKRGAVSSPYGFDRLSGSIPPKSTTHFSRIVGNQTARSRQ
jgi:hypothetical protein